MSSNGNSLKPGRVTRVTRASRILNVTSGSWGVVVAAPYQVSQEQWRATGYSGRAPNGPVADLVFYVGKTDAWEESAYINGKRPSETDEQTNNRRNRSLPLGVKKAVSMSMLGGMGIGAVDATRTRASRTPTRSRTNAAWRLKPGSRDHKDSRSSRTTPWSSAPGRPTDQLSCWV